MSTDYYLHTSGEPILDSRGSSAKIRTELDLIATAMGYLPSRIQLWSGSANFAVDSGAVNAYTITIDSSISSINATGLCFRFQTANTNTAASTLNGKSIVRPDGSALQAGDVVAAPGINQVTYNNTIGKFLLDSIGGSIYATNAAGSASAAAASATAAANSATTAASYASALTSTSTTSLAIGTGAKVFTTQASKGYAAGQFFSAISAANFANYMHGTVTSYVGTTLTTNVTDIGGSGTFADWNLSVSGSQGATGAQGSPGAWVYLSTVTPSASATADVETTFDSTYDVYAITGTLILPATDLADLQVRLKIGGTYQTANYEWHLDGSNSGATTYAGLAGSSTAFIKIADQVSNASTSGVDFIMYINRPSDTASRKKIETIGSSMLGSGSSTIKKSYAIGTYTSATSALTGVRFLFSSGNIASGTFRLYGISKT
jgi:hypothetical protein